MRVAAFVALILAIPGGASAQVTADADIVLLNGKVLTVDANDSIAEAIAIRGERIKAVGTSREISAMASARARRIDLKGRTVTPGMIDTHAHLTGGALREAFEINLSYPNARSMADVQRLLKERVSRAKPGEWITGSGWDEGKLAENRYIYAKDLDPVSPDNPVVLVHTMGHYSVVNTAALKAAGVTRDTPDPAGGTIDRAADGEPTGVLKEQATGLVRRLTPAYTPEQMHDAVVATAQRAASECLTAIKDPGIQQNQWDNYQRVRGEGKLPLRVGTLWFTPRTLEAAQALAEKIKPISRPGVDPHDDHLFSIGIKIGLDGSGGARTAWMHEDWNREFVHVDHGNKGYPVMDLGLAGALVRMYHDAGLHMGIHSIGDKAIDWTVDAYEALLKEKPVHGLRHSIIHGNTPSDRAIEKMAQMQKRFDAGYPEVQAPFLWWIGDTYVGNLGPIRSLRLKPLKTLQDHEVKWAGGSDYPVAPFEPRFGLWASVAREPLVGVYGKTPAGTANAVTVNTALRSYTDWASRQIFMEKKIGTIEAGKYADLAVWDRDVYAVPAAQLKDMKCSMTIFNGKVVHEL
jgi:predicted amidohydrolase YtcJ